MRLPEKADEKERLRKALYGLAQSHDWQVVSELLIEPSRKAEQEVLETQTGDLLYRAQGRARVLRELSGHVADAVASVRKNGF